MDSKHQVSKSTPFFHVHRPVYILSSDGSKHFVGFTASRLHGFTAEFHYRPLFIVQIQ